MTGSSRLRGIVLFAMAAVGLVGGHVLGYMVLAPDARQRGALLSRTGHWYFSKAFALAVAAAIVAGVASALLGAARGRLEGRRTMALRLAGLQVLSFVVLEVTERLLAGGSLGELLGPVLAIGIPLQVLVAALGVLVLALVAGTVAAAVRAFGRPWPRVAAARVYPRPTDRSVPRRIFSHAREIRGPPLPSSV